MEYRIGDRIRTNKDRGAIASNFFDQVGTVVGINAVDRVHVRFDDIDPPGVGSKTEWQDGGSYPWVVDIRAIAYVITVCPQCEKGQCELDDYLCRECRYGI